MLKFAEDMAPLSTSMLELRVTAGGVAGGVVTPSSTCHSWRVPSQLPVTSLPPEESMHAREEGREGGGGRREGRREGWREER